MTVRKRNDRWIVDIDFVNPDGTKKRVRKSSPVNTRRGAEQFEREIRQSLLNRTYQDEKKEEKLTLKKFSREYLKAMELANKPSTVVFKEGILRLHLLPVFGNRNLKDINTREIEKYKAEKTKDGLTKRSVNHHMRVLSNILYIAKDWGLVDSVPIIKCLKVEQPKFDFLSFDEAKSLIEATEGKEWRAMVQVALKAGLRQSEILALTWKDIDLENKRLVVNKAFVMGILGTPKNGKSREVPLCDDLVEALKNYKKGTRNLVFSPGKRRHRTPAQCRAALAKACKKAGLRRVGWHSLRHTFASHLVMKGAPLKTVSELLGHSTIKMTEIYAHLSPQVKRDAVQLLNSNGTIAAHQKSETPTT